MFAIGASGELRELAAIGRDDAVREVGGGLVVRRVEKAFHLELDDEASVQKMQHALSQTGRYPVSAVLAALGITDRVVDRVSLEGAKSPQASAHMDICSFVPNGSACSRSDRPSERRSRIR